LLEKIGTLPGKHGRCLDSLRTELLPIETRQFYVERLRIGEVLGFIVRCGEAAHAGEGGGMIGPQLGLRQFEGFLQQRQCLLHTAVCSVTRQLRRCPFEV
jgi:hypothetical protein